MSESPAPTPVLGTPAKICTRCDGRGWVEDAGWPSGRDLCPRCEGRRVVARALEEVG